MDHDPGGSGRLRCGGTALNPYRRTPGRIRIVGGIWGGRKLAVPAAAHLRPTPNRVRETLFNWLQPVIEGASCLDLFAGTGALGFEALSRGAGRVVMVEKNPLLVNELEQQAQVFEAQHLEIVQADAMQWLDTTTGEYDIIFIDPPFRENLWPKACELLINKGHLRDKTLIYLESGSKLNPRINHFQVVNQSRAGQVSYVLLEYGMGEAGINENNGDLSGDL